MAEFGDSLVIRLIADGSGLRQALDEALRGFDELQSRVNELSRSSSQLSRLGSAISGLQSPLQNLGRLFSQVKGQADALGQTVIGLNVGPALGALAALSAAIARVQAQLQSLSIPTGGAPIVPQLPSGGGGGPIRQFAEGGPVEGPPGIDRIPAMLTAGEFVLNRDAVRQLGSNFLQQVNSGASTTKTPSLPATPPLSTSQVTTQFGGVTVQVQHPSELGSVLETLMLEEVHLRNRRG